MEIVEVAVCGVQRSGTTTAVTAPAPTKKDVALVQQACNLVLTEGAHRDSTCIVNLRSKQGGLLRWLASKWLVLDTRAENKRQNNKRKQADLQKRAQEAEKEATEAKEKHAIAVLKDKRAEVCPSTHRTSATSRSGHSPTSWVCLSTHACRRRTCATNWYASFSD